ncbi:MAG: helix-turn-helix transcriptional regulator [Yaniella sp.]|nr:helix-turn-helix transcriptional regulator [Yaniella sp.]
MPESRLDSLVPEQIHALGHDFVTPAHTHPQGHLVYPATGVLSMVTDAGSWIAPPNRTVWIPAGFSHQHRAHGMTDMRIMFIPKYLAQLLPAPPVVLVVSPLARQAALTLTGDDSRVTAARNRLRRVLIDDLAAAAEQPLHLPEPHDERLQAVTHLVQHNMAEPVTLGALGKKIGASERTLSRLFHRETGMSFRQWRAQLRVHHAMLLLAEGRSVTDTSIACGWANPSAFIDAFTDLVGMTPGSYSRSLQSARPAEH